LGVDQLRREDFVHRGTLTRWHVEDAHILWAAEDRGGLASSDEEARVRLHARYGEVETIAFSQTAPHSATLYNKPREIRTKSHDKLWMADIWRRNHWDGIAPITRIEMRYAREALHELQWRRTDPHTGLPETVRCEGIDATLESLDRLWAYSTRQWLRHTTPNHKPRAEWPASPWWQAVQQATFGKVQTAPAQRQKAHAYHEGRILAAVLGYLESWSAYRAGKRVPSTLDLSTVARELVCKADDHCAARGSDFAREVLKKRKRIGFAQ
jgi:hypothetical protein